MFKVKHGDHKKRLYRIWIGMKYRCNNPNHSYYRDYGARGITVCGEWEKYENFRDWALSNGYQNDLTIDRIDNDKGYSPENCRWITMKKQSNNRRTNRVIECNGEKHTLSEWSEIVGVCVGTLWDRLKNGWSTERALFEPVHNNGGNRRKECPNCGAKMEDGDEA